MQNCTKADIEPQQVGADCYPLGYKWMWHFTNYCFEHFISPRIWYINPGACDTHFFQKCQSPNSFDETKN